MEYSQVKKTLYKSLAFIGLLTAFVPSVAFGASNLQIIPNSGNAQTQIHFSGSLDSGYFLNLYNPDGTNPNNFYFDSQDYTLYNEPAQNWIDVSGGIGQYKAVLTNGDLCGETDGTSADFTYSDCLALGTDYGVFFTLTASPVPPTGLLIV